MYKSNRVVFFRILTAHTESQLVYACLHKMYLQVFFEQLVFCVLAELNASENMRITCPGITACDFSST